MKSLFIIFSLALSLFVGCAKKQNNSDTLKQEQALVVKIIKEKCIVGQAQAVGDIPIDPHTHYNEMENKNFTMSLSCKDNLKLTVKSQYSEQTLILEVATKPLENPTYIFNSDSSEYKVFQISKETAENPDNIELALALGDQVNYDRFNRQRLALLKQIKMLQ